MLVALMGCVDGITRPAYFVGEASYAIILDSAALDTWFIRIGDSIGRVAHPGDSICVHFAADGNWQNIILTNAVWPKLQLQWIPHDVAHHVSLTFRGANWRETSMAARPC